MTQDHSAPLAQLDALKSAEVGAVFAELIRAVTHTTFPYVFCEMPPSARSGSGPMWSLRHWWWPPGCPSRAPGRCWAPRSGTVSPSGSGVSSWPASRPAGWPGCIWSSPMPTLGSNAAMAQQFSGSSWQRCRVHFMRNLHGAVSVKHAPAVTAAVKTVFAHTDPCEVAAQWDTVADSLAGSFPKVAAMMNEAKADVLALNTEKVWGAVPVRAQPTAAHDDPGRVGRVVHSRRRHSGPR